MSDKMSREDALMLLADTELHSMYFNEVRGIAQEAIAGDLGSLPQEELAQKWNDGPLGHLTDDDTFRIPNPFVDIEEETR
jgi:hypothetical protein